MLNNMLLISIINETFNMHTYVTNDSFIDICVHGLSTQFDKITCNLE